MESKSSDIIIFLLITISMILLMIGFIITILFLYKKKQLQYFNVIETLKIDYEKNLLSTQLEIQEQTFQNISREIHDNIGLSLTIAKLNLNTMDHSHSSIQEAQMNNTVDLISKAIEDLSTLSRSLNTDYIADNGLIKALELEISKIEKLGLYKIEFVLTGLPVFLESQKELVIFRIVQEALNNCIKHANASAINIHLHYNSNYLEIRIIDNGNGIIPTTNKQINGIGIKNMQQRASLIMGKCIINSVPGKGTNIFLNIPF